MCNFLRSSGVSRSFFTKLFQLGRCKSSSNSLCLLPAYSIHSWAVLVEVAGADDDDDALVLLLSGGVAPRFLLFAMPYSSGM